MSFGSGRERFFFHNGLTCLVKGLEEQYTLIDLRNESSVTGKISEVDGFMNVVMEDVVFLNQRGQEFSFDSFFVQARNIRYVHVPDSMPILSTIKQQLGMVSGHHRKKTLPRAQDSLKGKRLLQRQKETLSQVAAMKTDRPA